MGCHVVGPPHANELPPRLSVINDKSACGTRYPDLNKVRVGQKAFVTADAYGYQKFVGSGGPGRRTLGPKSMRTDEATERVGRRILETLVELERGAELPFDLPWMPISLAIRPK
jgi:hypothetical protein